VRLKIGAIPYLAVRYRVPDCLAFHGLVVEERDILFGRYKVNVKVQVPTNWVSIASDS
jgi:hypothetical protein